MAATNMKNKSITMNVGDRSCPSPKVGESVRNSSWPAKLPKIAPSITPRLNK